MTRLALRRVTAIEAMGGPVLRVDIDEAAVTTALRPAISKARNAEPRNALRLMKFGEEISPGFVDIIGL